MNERGVAAAGRTFPGTAFIVVILALSSFASVLLVAVPSAQPASAEALASWLPTTSYPSIISGGSCAISGGYIYCVGGLLSTNSTNVYYAPVSSSGIGAWKLTTGYPTHLTDLSCVTSTGYIYCVGGYDGTAPVATNYYASVSSSGVGSWTQTTAYPTAIAAQSCVASGGYIYCVAGGSAGAFYSVGSTAVYYAPISSTGIGKWAATTDYPTPSSLQSCAASSPATAGAYVYCVGNEVQGGAPIDTTYYAPISSGGVGTWASTTSYPAGDFGGSCVTTGGYLYCVGGYPGLRAYPDAGVHFASISASGAIGGWVDSAPYPVNVAYQSCAASGGYIYCVGGGNTEAAYYTSTASSSTGMSSHITVTSADQYGLPLVGYYTVLFDQADRIVTTGYSPTDFTVRSDQQYTIQADDYGSCTFQNWQDSASLDRQRPVSIEGDVQFTAVYSCNNTLDIFTVNSTGAPISGYYATLSSQSGQLQSCYSPCHFQLESGQTYQITLANYGGETLGQWGDGQGNIYSWGGTHTLVVPGGADDQGFTEFLTATFDP